MPPTVSILIATRNEEGSIENCIDSIICQNYPKEKIEILIIDGCSNDGTLAIIERLMLENRIDIKTMINKNIFQSFAWNKAIRKSSSDLILILSAHSRIKKDYIKKCAYYLHQTGAANVGGPQIPTSRGYIGNTIQLGLSSFFGSGGGRFRSGKYEGFVDTVYLGAWPKEIFSRYGYFDERLIRNQDIEFNARLRSRGENIYLNNNIRSEYICRDSLLKLWIQNFGNGLWVIYTKSIAPYCHSLRHFIPLLFISILILVSLISVISKQVQLGSLQLICSTILLTISVSYLFANFMFSFLIAIKNGLRYFILMPIVFTILHFSYGLGSLYGLITLPYWYKKNKNLSQY